MIRGSLKWRFSILLLGAVPLALTAPMVADAQSSTKTYTYDALGRLVIAKTTGGSNNNEIHSICYDKAGNRTSYNSTSNGSNAACVGPPSPTPTQWTATLTSDVTDEPFISSGYIDPDWGSLSNNKIFGCKIKSLSMIIFHFGAFPMNQDPLIHLTLGDCAVIAPNSGWETITLPYVGTLKRVDGKYSTYSNTVTWQWVVPRDTDLMGSGTVTIQ